MLQDESSASIDDLSRVGPSSIELQALIIRGAVRLGRRRLVNLKIAQCLDGFDFKRGRQALAVRGHERDGGIGGAVQF